MGFVTKRGGGGGGGDDGSGDELLGESILRCSVCRRELLPWEATCPDDGGAAIAPGELTAPHDDMLARLLADDGDPDVGPDGEATAADDDTSASPPATDDDGPVWPVGDGIG